MIWMDRSEKRQSRQFCDLFQAQAQAHPSQVLVIGNPITTAVHDSSKFLDYSEFLDCDIVFPVLVIGNPITTAVHDSSKFLDYSDFPQQRAENWLMLLGWGLRWRALPNEAQQTESKKFKLHFEGKLPSRLYTGNNITAEGPVPIKLELQDALSGRIVANGPSSLLKVEIVALHGHFKAEQLEEWTQSDFDDNIVHARDGKRPLLVGERVIALHNGIGFIDGINFTDNSSWVRSKKFRLGARVLKDDQVKEAVSGPFEVKDRRGEIYQKHDTPSLEDEVWRLHKIAKDGKICKRLAEHQIFNVRDFLKQYQIDQNLLRQILNVSPKVWEAIAQQANLCLSSNVQLEQPSNLTTTNILPTVPLSQIRTPNPALQNLYVPAASQDESEISIMSYNHSSMSLNDEPAQLNPSAYIDNNSFVTEAFAGGLDQPAGPSDPVYGQDMFNDVRAASNWVSIAQPAPNYDHLGMSVPSTITLNMQDPSPSTSSGIAMPETAGWSRIPAV